MPEVFFCNGTIKKKMANYVVSILWKFWSGERPTTAVALVQACDQHIGEKQGELAQLQKKETSHAAALADAAGAAKDAKERLQREKDRLTSTVINMEDRFRTVRNAINIAFESQDGQSDAAESLGQLCTIVEGFSRPEFEGAVRAHAGCIGSAKEAYENAKTLEVEANDRLKGTASDMRTVENHIKELGEIKVQLDKRLNDKFD